MLVREKPPLRLSVKARAPNGVTQRWGIDEPDPANVFSGLRFGDSMPGGFDSFEAKLPRRSRLAYSDLERLTRLTVLGAGGDVVGLFRLDSAPRQSGGELGVTAQGVGYQAHLEDNKSASMVYVDADLSHWQNASNTYKAVLIGFALSGTVLDPSVEPDYLSGLPALVLVIDGAANKPYALADYDAGAAVKVSSIYYSFTPGGYDATDTAFAVNVGVMDDDLHANESASSDLAAAAAAGTYTPATARRFGMLRFNHTGVLTGANTRRASFASLRVYGDHGLTKRGTEPAAGFYASDVIAHALGRWAPQIDYTLGSDGSIQQTSFVIPHLEFRDRTTAAEIIRQADRFSLSDWAVWDGPNGNPRFYYNARGARGRRWRARIAPSQLSETGASVARLWNGVVVRYTDPGGTVRTVGPTGSDADATDASLIDTDPLNPANIAGVRRWDLLDATGTQTQASAIQLGSMFLTATRELDSSGSARLVGYVEDDRGVLHPYHRVRAGDQISFVDAADKSYRRIVRTEKVEEERTTSIDLDAPPDALASVLERLGAVLVPYGLGA